MCSFMTTKRKVMMMLNGVQAGRSMLEKTSGGQSDGCFLPETAGQEDFQQMAWPLQRRSGVCT